MSNTEPDFFEADSEEASIIQRKHSVIEDVIVVILTVLSLGGIAVMDHARQEGYIYWIVMIFIFAIAAVVLGATQAKRGKHQLRSIIREQLLHWLGVLLALGGILLLIYLQAFTPDTASYAILLTLSLATYLDGVRIGWRFGLVGNFLGLTAVVIAYTPSFMWVLYTIALIMIGLIVYSDKGHMASTKTGRTNDDEDDDEI